MDIVNCQDYDVLFMAGCKDIKGIFLPFLFERKYGEEFFIPLNVKLPMANDLVSGEATIITFCENEDEYGSSILSLTIKKDNKLFFFKADIKPYGHGMVFEELKDD